MSNRSQSESQHVAISGPTGGGWRDADGTSLIADNSRFFLNVFLMYLFILNSCSCKITITAQNVHILLCSVQKSRASGLSVTQGDVRSSILMSSVFLWRNRLSESFNMNR